MNRIAPLAVAASRTPRRIPGGANDTRSPTPSLSMSAITPAPGASMRVKLLPSWLSHTAPPIQRSGHPSPFTSPHAACSPPPVMPTSTVRSTKVCAKAFDWSKDAATAAQAMVVWRIGADYSAAVSLCACRKSLTNMSRAQRMSACCSK